ncbi:MAG: aldehyde ferredoxin oxidoreductase family protein [Chloroflexi bacterium]|nr:aldehyde ferredoxin oxidoreductase family protein [Chloroflexota bacterium]
MYGFYNRLLRVDVGTRSWTSEDIPDEILTQYLGGKGLGAHLLQSNSPTGVDPLSPENPFIITTGPATGSVLAAAGRHCTIAKSPLTGVFGESYSGGHVAPRIKATGYDAIIVQGAADTPVFIEISDQAVHIHDATAFWGMDSYETQDALQDAVAVRGARAIAIGPAGEQMIPFAVVGNDHGRHAGRTGMGAVLGSKRVKGIVFHGGATCPLADSDAIESYDRALRERGRDDPAALSYRKFGTPSVVAIANRAGAFPSYYWSTGTVPYWEQINADTMVEQLRPRPKACYRCFLACGKYSKVSEGRHAGLEGEGPEYETIYAFGGLCGVDDLAEILYLNMICDRLGIDTITAGNVAGFAIEASRRGAIDLKLDYGDVDGIAELLTTMVSREEPGAIFAQGVRAASRALGLEDLAVHVKGLEPAGYEPRTLKGMGLAYAISDRGACHLRATVYKAEFAGWADRTATEGKADLVLDFEDRHTIFDTLILCRFYRDLIGWDDLSTVISGLTGLDLDKSGLRALSGRVADTIRAFNLREGMTAADDTLPPRLLREPLASSGETLTEAELELMLDEYYDRRGWSR